MSFLGLKPTFLRKGTSFSLHSSYLQHKYDNDPNFKKKQQLVVQHAFSKPFQAPVDGGVVHLVDENDEVFDSSRFGQHGVLSRLAALLKARLKLPLPGGNNLTRNR